MPKIIWQRYHVLHTGSQAHTLAKNLGYPRQPKPATKRGNLKGHPPRSATREKKGKQMARWGSRYLQLPQVTCSVSFTRFLSPSLYPLFVALYLLWFAAGANSDSPQCSRNRSSVFVFRSVALTDLLWTPAVPQPQVGGPSLLSFVNLDCLAMQHILFYVQTPEMSIAKKERGRRRKEMLFLVSNCNDMSK